MRLMSFRARYNAHRGRVIDCSLSSFDSDVLKQPSFTIELDAKEISSMLAQHRTELLRKAEELRTPCHANYGAYSTLVIPSHSKHDPRSPLPSRLAVLPATHRVTLPSGKCHAVLMRHSRSGAFAAFSSRRDCNQRTKRIIDRLRIGKRLGQFRVDEHDVDSAAVPVDVLAADAAGKVVLRSHFTRARLRGRFLHNCVSHAWLPGER